MFRNYFKIALRNIYRNKIFTLINVAGLSVGIACFILISLWIKDELSYDRFHENLEQIYQVNKEYHMGNEVSTNPSTPYPLTGASSEQIPEVATSTHYYRTSVPVKYRDLIFQEDHVCFTDSNFFSIFTFDFIRGDPAKALSNPNSIILSKTIAHKYFADIDPVGKIITVNNRHELMVVGVINDIPSNSEFQFDLFVPVDNVTNSDDEVNWGDHWLITYLLLEKNSSIMQVEHKLTEMIQERIPEEKLNLKLQSLKDLHLKSIDGNQAGMKYVIFFSAIGVFILVIACINYMNLSTARSLKRELEIGIRKTVGSSRKNLIMQFLTESFIFSTLSLIIALIMVELCRPTFNTLTGKSLEINYFEPGFFFLLFGLLIFTGLLAGSYPAVALSKFRAMDIFHGETGFTLKSGNFRKGLVIIQFVVTIVLITGIAIILMQLRFIRTKNLGYDPENLIYLPINRDIYQNYRSMKEELLKHQGIHSVSASSELPGEIWSIMRGITWEGKKTDGGAAFGFLAIDEDYFETVGTKLIIGNKFQADYAKDTASVILNEKAIDVMQMQSPIGGHFDIGDDYLYNIIGITQDFNSLPLNYKIEPIVMMNEPRNYRRMLIRINPDQWTTILPFLEELWKKISPNNPFEYHFLSERFESIYRSEIRAGKIFGTFVILAIIISSLGLFGLTSFITEQRTKEIGIRKAYGAKLGEIVLMLVKETSQWVLIAIIIASPISWFLMRKWLQNFEYRADLSWWIFVLSGLSALMIALLTVSYQSFSAGRRNPADSLRCE